MGYQCPAPRKLDETTASMVDPKAELLQDGIFCPHPFICQRRFTNEKVGNQKT